MAVAQHLRNLLGMTTILYIISFEIKHGSFKGPEK